jgi:putative hemolysin
MLPTEEIFTLDLGHSMAESLTIAHTDMHTRFPVCAKPGDPQSICGYVNFKDIVSELRLSPNQPSLRGIMRSMPEMLEDLSIATSLERMIHGHVHIAMVRGSEGKIVGMVTLEDLLEELVGEIEDEYDRAPGHVTHAGAGWVMGGGVSLQRLQQVTGVALDQRSLQSDCHNLDELVRAALGRPVRGGDLVRTSGLRILVRKVRRQQVLEAHVSREGAEPADQSMPTAERGGHVGSDVPRSSP